MDKKEKDALLQLYKERGIQQLSLKEYLAMKEKEAKKKNRKLPLPARIILISPLVIIFCFGIFWIPYIIYTIATAPEIKQKDSSERSLKYEDLMKKR